MKNLIIIVIALIFISLPSIVLAQDLSLPTPTTEEQPVLPIGEENPEEETPTTPAVSEETQTTFINGVAVGAIVGLITGGIFAWFLKDKLIK